MRFFKKSSVFSERLRLGAYLGVTNIISLPPFRNLVICGLSRDKTTIGIGGGEYDLELGLVSIILESDFGVGPATKIDFGSSSDFTRL